MLLSREIRFALVPANQFGSAKPGNSWAGWPSTNLVVPQLVLCCLIEGEVETFEDDFAARREAGSIPSDEEIAEHLAAYEKRYCS